MLSTVSRKCASEVYSGEGGWGVVCGRAKQHDGKTRMSSERESEETRFCCMVAWVSGVYCGTLEVLNEEKGYVAWWNYCIGRC